MVIFNALSGSIAYARMRRIDYRSGLRFAAAGIPGSVLGALAVHLVPRHAFDAIMAAVLAILSVVVIRLRPHAHVATATSHFVLVWMSGTASATHLVGGTITVGHGLRRAIALSVGVLPGAQLGARLSRRFTGPTIRKFLGVALLGLAVRLLISAIP